MNRARECGCPRWTRMQPSPLRSPSAQHRALKSAASPSSLRALAGAHRVDRAAAAEQTTPRTAGWACCSSPASRGCDSVASQNSSQPRAFLASGSWSTCQRLTTAVGICAHRERSKKNKKNKTSVTFLRQKKTASNVHSDVLDQKTAEEPQKPSTQIKSASERFEKTVNAETQQRRSR